MTTVAIENPTIFELALRSRQQECVLSTPVVAIATTGVYSPNDKRSQRQECESPQLLTTLLMPLRDEDVFLLRTRSLLPILQTEPTKNKSTRAG